MQCNISALSGTMSQLDLQYSINLIIDHDCFKQHIPTTLPRYLLHLEQESSHFHRFFSRFTYARRNNDIHRFI
ncbi:uncharacterized protein EAF02_008729 [Botrytis sinoallii]|uniref:uncharacterized protein n=1 Tax=Botrytis sinoallii TaxID=1463999 RepID=UPI001901672C|nr:uncharacterized protein EAF02_008729 [Botrytis sinoallii]KAF7872658.1 hypothetical protein EAF02_008729 [Botrytis sinoallii]